MRVKINKRKKNPKFYNLDLSNIDRNNKMLSYCQENNTKMPNIKYAFGSKLFSFYNEPCIDMCLNFGSLILGHAHRNETLAIKKTIEKGARTGFLSEEELELKLYFKNKLPHIDSMRFVNSGEEAIRLAIISAIKFSGKRKVIRFKGAYTDFYGEDFLDIISLHYNNIDDFHEAILKNRDNLACVVIEPIATHYGLINPDLLFIKTIRELTEKFGIILIFDEITSGFRVKSIFEHININVIPDIVCLGKVMGGSLSLGAYGGKKDIVSVIGERDIPNYNAVTLKSSLSVLKLIDNKFIDKLIEKTDFLSNKLNLFSEEKGSGFYFYNHGSMISLCYRKNKNSFYTNLYENILSYEDYAKIFKMLLGKGIILPPNRFSPFYISCMHSKKDIGEILSSFKSVL